MSTSLFATSRINLPKVPSYRAAHKYARLSEEQQDYIFRNSRKTLVLGWLALFGSDIKEQDEALTSLIKYCHTAVHRPYLPDRFIDSAVHDVLAQFAGLTEQEALEFEKRTLSLQYLANRITSRAINVHRHQEDTEAGKAERKTKSLSILDTDGEETQARLEVVADTALAVGTKPEQQPYARIKHLLNLLTTNRERAIEEIGEGGTEVYACTVAALNDKAVAWSVEFGDSRKVGASITKAIETKFRCSQRTAQIKKKRMTKKIAAAVSRGSSIWSSIRNGLAEGPTGGDNVISQKHHISRGKRPITTAVKIDL